MTRSPPSQSGQTANPRQSIEKGILAPGVPLTPGKDPFPLSGQRAVRGWLVLVLLLFVVLDIVLAGLLLMRAVNRTARVAPSAAHIGSIQGMAHETTDIDAQVFAMRYVGLAETWSYDDIDGIAPMLRPYLHASLQPKIEKQMKEVIETAKRNWQHRSALVRKAMIGGRSNGIITLGVAFEVIEQTGQRKEDKRITGRVLKVALMEVVQDVASLENPQGLLVTSYRVGKQEDWLAAGFPAFWEKPAP